MDASPATAPAPADVLGPAGTRVAFRCRDRDVTYVDALQALALRGGWQPVVDDVSRAERALDGADDVARADLEERLPARETALRRRLRLTAADDYLAWLEQRGLTVADCREHLLRRSALEAVEPPDAHGSPALTALRAHVVLEGVLDDAVRRLAEDAALADVDPQHPSWVAEVVARAEQVRTDPPDPDEVAAVVAERSSDWTRVVATVAVVPDDDVARELVLCVHEQHATLAQVAADVGIAVEHVATTMDAVDPALEPLLVGAEPGEVHGPLPYGSARVVVEVQERVRPSPLDDEAQRLATEELLRRRAAVAMSALVRWSADD